MSDRKKLLEDTARRSIAYREAIEGRHVAPDSQAIADLDAFREALPEQGASDRDTIALLDKLGSPAAVAMTGPRYFGFVIGGSMPVTLAANWLVSAWDQNAAMHEVTPAVAILEQVSIDWMLDLLGLPAESGAAFVTGATVANFTSLARRALRCTGNHGFRWCRGASNPDEVIVDAGSR
jgi:glutamate/tyrosine decarboxylase-like PLP-dependent enzyme